MTARIAVVGTGWWATGTHIPTLQDCDDTEIAAICDLDEERLAITGETFGIAARYTDIDAMLAAEKPDGVIVGTPHVHHAGPAIAALEAGAHVLVEKPMATTAADARAIAAAASRAERQVMVATGLNFTGYTAIARDWVQSGLIGELRHAVCSMGSPLDDLMAGQPMAETKDALFRPPASTWADPKKAGGYGWGQMSHSLAWLAWVTDLGFESLFAMDVKSPAGVDYYDAAAGRLKNGATVAISGASTVPKHVGMHTDVRLFGTEGMLTFSNLPAMLELRRHDGADRAVPMTDFDGLYDGALPVRLFAALCNGKEVTNPSDGICGVRVTEALDAIYRSAASGRMETV